VTRSWPVLRHAVLSNHPLFVESSSDAGKMEMRSCSQGLSKESR